MLTSPHPQLRRGQTNESVSELQKRLAHHGFLAAAEIDGDFGAKTETAVKTFQNVRGLTVDGVVGAETWRQLFSDLELSEIEVFLLGYCQQCGVTDVGQIAYILATSKHESGLGQWMEEWASGADYEGRTDLGNIYPGDGTDFKGRGYVQITGRDNYKYWSDRLGIDLISRPKLAAQPDIAAQILVMGMRDGTFTGCKLTDFIEGLEIDFINARRIINGLDRAEDIAAIAEHYLNLLKTELATLPVKS